MAHTFRTESSELLVDAPIIALRRDQVRMPDGNLAAREIVEHFGATAIVALDEENRVALIRQYRQCVGQRLLELPAGILDKAGEPALDCAQRELMEEAGLAAQHWEVLTDLVTSPGFCDEAVRVYLARGLRDVEKPEGSEEEADLELQWVPIAEAVGMVFRGEIVNSIAIAGIMTAHASLLGVATPRPVDAPFTFRPTRLAQRRQAEGFVEDMKKRNA